MNKDKLTTYAGMVAAVAGGVGRLGLAGKYSVIGDLVAAAALGVLGWATNKS